MRISEVSGFVFCPDSQWQVEKECKGVKEKNDGTRGIFESGLRISFRIVRLFKKKNSLNIEKN